MVLGKIVQMHLACLSFALCYGRNETFGDDSGKSVSEQLFTRTSGLDSAS